MQRAILLSGFLLSTSLFLSAQATGGRAAAPPSRTAAPTATTPPANPGQTPGTTVTNTPQLTDTIGQPVGATPTQGPAAQVPNTNANTGATATQAGTTPPPSSVPPGVVTPGELGVTNVTGMANAAQMTTTGQAPGAGTASAGMSATMPPQMEMNTSLTPAQVIGIGNFGGTDSAYSVPVNQETLADAAREARQKLAKDRPRVFNNNDIARLRQAAGEPATPGLVTNEQTMPASDVTAPNTRSNNAPNNQQNSNGVESNMPASDQTPTTPPTNMNQRNRRPSPFRQKK